MNEYDVFIAFHGSDSKDGSYEAAKEIANYLIENNIFPYLCNYCGLINHRNLSYQDTLAAVCNSDLFLLVVSDSIKNRLNDDGYISKGNHKNNYLENEMNQFKNNNNSLDRSNCVLVGESELNDSDFQKFHPLMRGHQYKLIGKLKDKKDILNWILNRKNKYNFKDKNINEVNYYYKNDYKIGDTITFGNYYTVDNNQKTEIKWEVIDLINNSYLLLSKDVLYRCSFKSKEVSLYDWLNNEFYNEAFSELEKDNIIKNDNNVFVLSKEQIEKYYPDNEKRVKRITAYAKKERLKDGVNIHEEDYSFYWTSTVDGIKNCCVLDDGDFYFMRSEAEFIGVAPAIMIKK